MKQIGLIIIATTFLFCTPKGPQTFNSPYIGKTKSDLIAIKGPAKTIKVFDNAEAHIYKTKEEYFGKKVSLEKMVVIIVALNLMVIILICNKVKKIYVMIGQKKLPRHFME